MSATIHILPVVNLFRPWQPDWREQYERECAAVVKAMQEPPPRTRPILIREESR